MPCDALRRRRHWPNFATQATSRKRGTEFEERIPEVVKGGAEIFLDATMIGPSYE